MKWAKLSCETLPFNTNVLATLVGFPNIVMHGVFKHIMGKEVLEVDNTPHVIMGNNFNMKHVQIEGVKKVWIDKNRIEYYCTGLVLPLERAPQEQVSYEDLV